MTPLPWDDLGDAFARLEDAERAGDETELAAAQANATRAQEHLGALGGLLFLMMLDHGTNTVRTRLVHIVGELTDPACNKADKAVRMAVRVWREMDALKIRMRELEEQLANLTPGVGEPVDEEELALR
jgi:hypothetical protein